MKHAQNFHGAEVRIQNVPQSDDKNANIGRQESG